MMSRARLPLLGLSLALALPGCIDDERAAADPDPDGAPALDAAVDGAPDAALADARSPDAAPDPDAAPPSCGNEDDLAPNQVQADASEISASFSRDDLFMCAGSEDWFRVRGDQALTIRVVADPPQRDLDLFLYDADGVELGQSVGEDGRERIRFAGGAGEVFIRVVGYRDQTAFYALSVTAACQTDAQCGPEQVCERSESLCVDFVRGRCGDDAYEPNDRDFEAMVALEPGSLEGALCAADRDWFLFEVVDAEGFDLQVEFEPGYDVDLWVIDEAGHTVAQATSGDQNPERLRLRFLPAGRYRLGLVAYAERGAELRDFAYRLDVRALAGDRCRIDRDCPSDGFPVCSDGVCRPVDGAGGVPLGGRCGADSDCDAAAEFCWSGGAGGHDNVCTVACDDFDQCGALGAEAECTPVARNLAVCLPGCQSDDQCSLFRTCVGGTCELRGECAGDRDCAETEVCEVTQFGRFCRADAGVQIGCGADPAPNDRQADATPLVADGVPVEGLAICDEDRDWFRVDVPPESAAWQLTVGVTFRAGVDIDVYLYDERGQPLGEATSPDRTDEVIQLRYAAPGAYFVLVDQFASDALADTAYAVRAELVDNDDRCTVAGNECGGTTPLRAQCDEATGACAGIDGQGALPLGALCDSNDDCDADAEVCWTFEGGEEGYNRCTHQCRDDAGCAAIEGSVCTPFQGGQFAVCLPPRG